MSATNVLPPAWFEVITNKWQFPPENMKLLFEQGESKASLREWLVLDRSLGEELKRVNETAKRLGTVWRGYKDVLIPAKSLLISLPRQPKFL